MSVSVNADDTNVTLVLLMVFIELTEIVKVLSHSSEVCGTVNGATRPVGYRALRIDEN